MRLGISLKIFFSIVFPDGQTVYNGLTQPLTEMRERNKKKEQKREAAKHEERNC